jgi:hypothetical protein
MTEADFEFEGTEGNESIRQDNEAGYNFMQPQTFEAAENEGLQVRTKAFQE